MQLRAFSVAAGTLGTVFSSGHLSSHLSKLGIALENFSPAIFLFYVICFLYV